MSEHYDRFKMKNLAPQLGLFWTAGIIHFEDILEIFEELRFFYGSVFVAEGDIF